MRSSIMIAVSTLKPVHTSRKDSGFYSKTCSHVQENRTQNPTFMYFKLWLIHTARDRDRDRDWDGHNRKQW